MRTNSAEASFRPAIFALAITTVVTMVALFDVLGGALQILPVAEAQDSAPEIKFDSQVFDFGTVDEGAIIDHTFKVSNQGQTTLKIVGAHAACGCTTPKFEKKTLEPGETTNLFVTVDTSMKQNAVTKTVNITSNDPRHPVVEIALKMFVRNQHKGLSEGAKAKILTDEHCASCHVARGVGTFGLTLYNADCAMCHGPKAEGESGPPLIGPYDNAAYFNHMKEVLKNGSKKTNAMPGFSGEAGGPLAQEQIDSLLTYLKELSAKRMKK